MWLKCRKVNIFAEFSDKEQYIQNVIQVNDADMPLSSSALISCQSEISPVLILTEAYLQHWDTMDLL